MVRMSKEAKAVSNEKIIGEAARLFRERGLENTGVAQVMQAAGLTHGGFYRHFSSKEELAQIAIKRAFEPAICGLRDSIAKHGATSAISTFIDQYLSQRHVERPGFGCPIAALGGEVARSSRDLKEAFEIGTNRLIDLLAQGIEGERDERHVKASGMLFTLVGALVLARTAKSKTAVQEILKTGRQSAKLLISS